jgi:hypothetical protein
MYNLAYNMTPEQYKEYLRLKKASPRMTEIELFTAITGSVLCLGKTLFKQLGYTSITQIFFNGSIVFFWTLIIISIIKGIEKTHKSKTRFAGITQLIGSGISTLFMLR